MHYMLNILFVTGEDSTSLESIYSITQQETERYNAEQSELAPIMK